MNRLSIRLSCRNCLALLGQLILFWLVAGCEKDPVPLTTDSTIKGSVYADSAGKEIYRINVKAVGPYGEKSIVTEKKDFLFEGLGNGTYYLEYSKEGYGTICQYGFQLFGGDVVRAPALSLYQLPKNTTIPKFIRAYTADATSPPSPYIYIYIDMAVTNIKPSDVSAMLFMSTDKNVAWNNFEFCHPNDYGGTKNNIPYIRFDCIPPFKSGTEVFLRGYPCNIREFYGSGSYDFYHGSPSFSTLDKTKPTNVVSFMMP